MIVDVSTGGDQADIFPANFRGKVSKKSKGADLWKLFLWGNKKLKKSGFFIVTATLRVVKTRKKPRIICSRERAFTTEHLFTLIITLEQR